MVVFVRRLVFVLEFLLAGLCLATPRGWQDLSSLTNDQTFALQGKPRALTTRPPGNSQDTYTCPESCTKAHDEHKCRLYLWGGRESDGI